MTTWRNVHHFTDAPEIAHDGHAVTLTSEPYAPDDAEPDSLMQDVHCLTCGDDFSAFIEELDEEN